MGKKHKGDRAPVAGDPAPVASDDPQAVVRQLIKAGKVKKKCCKSKPRCKKCPVVALKKATAELPARTVEAV